MNTAATPDEGATTGPSAQPVRPRHRRTGRARSAFTPTVALVSTGLMMGAVISTGATASAAPAPAPPGRSAPVDPSTVLADLVDGLGAKDAVTLSEAITGTAVDDSDPSSATLSWEIDPVALAEVTGGEYDPAAPLRVRLPEALTKNLTATAVGGDGETRELSLSALTDLGRVIDDGETVDGVLTPTLDSAALSDPAHLDGLAGVLRAAADSDAAPPLRGLFAQTGGDDAAPITAERAGEVLRGLAVDQSVLRGSEAQMLETINEMVGAVPQAGGDTDAAPLAKTFDKIADSGLVANLGEGEKLRLTAEDVNLDDLSEGDVRGALDKVGADTGGFTLDKNARSGSGDLQSIISEIGNLASKIASGNFEPGEIFSSLTSIANQVISLITGLDMAPGEGGEDTGGETTEPDEPEVDEDDPLDDMSFNEAMAIYDRVSEALDERENSGGGTDSGGNSGTGTNSGGGGADKDTSGGGPNSGGSGKTSDASGDKTTQAKTLPQTQGSAPDNTSGGGTGTSAGGSRNAEPVANTGGGQAQNKAAPAQGSQNLRPVDNSVKGNAPASEGQVHNAAAKGSLPVTGSNSHTTAFVVGGVLMLIAGAGIAVFTRTRRQEG